ncbi:MAG TPA: hypothetical protein VKU19_01865 [Bryobacteraceae bacterium]|nr:hypothetical protein [Bryobacteraceae bacterium]
MDLYKIIQTLYAEKARLESIIASLESLQGINPQVPKPRSTRGRKSMGVSERKEVSARMKKYWEKRRRKEQGDTPGEEQNQNHFAGLASAL